MTRVITFAITYLLLAAPQVLCQESNWEFFSPKYGEAKVLMPTPVSTDKTDYSYIEQYVANENDARFIVIIGPTGGQKNLDKYTKSVQDGMKDESLGSFEDIGYASGKGWTGKQFLASGAGLKMVCLVTIDSSGTEGVTLGTTASKDDPRVDKFFNSLEVYPDQVKKKSAKKLEKLFSPKNIIPIIGFLLAALAFILIFISNIWFLIVAFQTHVGWGFGVLFGFGIGHIAFLAYDFKKVSIPFVIFIVSALILLTGCLMMVQMSI